MITKVKVAGEEPATAELRRERVFSFASMLILPHFPENCKPPGHLTGLERLLWREAERVKAIDYHRFCILRQRLLLSQAQRWQPAR